MRWLISSVATLALVGVIIGCHHTAGVCDCDQGGDHCAGNPGPVILPGGPGGKAPETIKEMPKTDDKAKEKEKEKAPEAPEPDGK